MRDITLEETVYFNFTTRAFASGVPTALSGSPVLSVLESNNATPITSGVSVSVDRASVTGLNQATVVATAANGYEAGKSYAVYISTGTVGGVSVVGEVVAQFTVQSGAAFTRLGAPAGASVSADVAAVKTQTAAIEVDTADIQGRLPAALVSGRIDASVGAMASGVLTATAIDADAITDAKVASDVTIASVTGAVGSVTGAVGSVTGNVGGNVTGSVGSVASGGISAASFAAGAIDASAIAADAIGSSELAASAVAEIADAVWDELLSGHAISGSAGEALSAANAPTAAAVADAVWDEILSGHAVSGSTGEALSAAGGAGDPWITALPGSYTAGQAGYIIGTNVNATISSRASQSSLDTVDGIVDSILVDTAEIGAAGAGLTALATAAALATVDTVVDAILVDTAEIGAAGAGLTALATAANLATVAGYLDTEIAAIKAKTDNLPAAPAATGDIPTATQNADALLNRDMSAVSDTNSRSPLNALRFIRNKWDVAATTLTVKKEDDSTTAWTATVSTSPGADPIVGNDPA